MKNIALTVLFMFFLINIMNAEDSYFIYNSSGKRVSVEEMAKTSSGFDVIFFGEFHDDSLNHALQLEYLEEMFDENDELTVSLEMFERDVQKQLDAYINGDMTEEEFLKVSRPWPDYNKFYKPLVELAKDNDSKVIAANIPRKYAAMYVSGGMTAYQKLTDEEKSYVAKTLVLSEDKYLDKFLETMAGSKESVDSLPVNEENTLYLYYGAQSIKDETMAESILDYHKAEPATKIIHFNGDFHSNSFLGTAAMLQRRAQNLKIAVITPIYYDNIDSVKFTSDLAGQGNFVIFIPQPKREPLPQMMGGSSTHFGENYVVEHNITVKINPANSSLQGEDRIRFKNPILKSSSVKLLKSLEIIEMSSADKNLKFSVKSDDEYYNEIIIENLSLKNQSYENGGIKESFEAVIKYAGKVFYTPSETNMITRHSNTPGIISGLANEGIYLPGSAFYPRADKDLAAFKAQITLPKNYKLITSGDITSEEIGNDIVYKVVSEQVLDEMILVAGIYKTIEQIHDGVKFAVYYYNDAQYLQKYLNESINYYKEYTKLFGKYPYKSFSVVENFFATGFGMPGYTLLSNKLMVMPWVTLSPGSLAHEFVHNWWGNSVFTDNNAGNWCEALTTFSTNYYYNIITGNKKDELDWRRKALMSIDALPAEKNYPVGEFKYQRDTYDAVIGYSKGGFIFQEMLKLMGKERFFAALKSFSDKYSGKRAFWMNLTSEFTEKTKDTLTDIKMRSVMNDWLKTKDIPEIKLADSPTFYQDSITISISSNIKRVMSVPVTFNFIDSIESVKHYVLLKDTINRFTFPMKEFNKLSSIELDKELESLRKLNFWEVPYSFNRVLSSKPLIVLPEKTSPEFVIAMKYVNTMKESGFEFDYNTLDNLSNDDLKYSSLILLGNIKSNKLIETYSVQMPAGLTLNDKGFFYAGKQTDFKEDILMANVAHLNSMDKFCTIIYFDGLEDDAPLNRLIHYQSYSLVLLNSKRSGRPAYSQEIYPINSGNSSLKWDKSTGFNLRGFQD